jgi:hypothetical protein
MCTVQCQFNISTSTRTISCKFVHTFHVTFAGNDYLPDAADYCHTTLLTGGVWGHTSKGKHNHKGSKAVLEAAARYIATRCSSSSSSSSSSDSSNSSSTAAGTINDDTLSAGTVAAVCNELCSGSSTSSATSTHTGKTPSSSSRGSTVKRRKSDTTSHSSRSSSSSSSITVGTTAAETRAERFLPLVLASIAQYDMTVVKYDDDVPGVEHEGTVKKHPIGFPPNLWQALQDGVFWCRVVLEEAEHGRNGAWMQVTVNSCNR